MLPLLRVWLYLLMCSVNCTLVSCLNIFIHLVNFMLLNDNDLAYQGQNELSLMVSGFHIGECQSIGKLQYIKKNFI